jgi:hypothetical protein
MVIVTTAPKACRTFQTNNHSEAHNHSPHLPQELWTLVTSRIPYTEL